MGFDEMADITYILLIIIIGLFILIGALIWFFVAAIPDKIKSATIEKIEEERKKVSAQALGIDFEKKARTFTEAIFGKENVKRISATDISIIYGGIRIVVECKKSENLGKADFEQVLGYKKREKSIYSWIVIPDYLEAKQRDDYLPEVVVYKMSDYLNMCVLVKEAKIDVKKAGEIVQKMKKYQGDISELYKRIIESRVDIGKADKKLGEAVDITNDLKRSIKE